MRQVSKKVVCFSRQTGHKGKRFARLSTLSKEIGKQLKWIPL